jgi:hypothetical protein
MSSMSSEEEGGEEEDSVISLRLLSCLDVDGCGDTVRCFLRGFGRVVVFNASAFKFHVCSSVMLTYDMKVKFTHFISRRHYGGEQIEMWLSGSGCRPRPRLDCRITAVLKLSIVDSRDPLSLT